MSNDTDGFGLPRSGRRTLGVVHDIIREQAFDKAAERLASLARLALGPTGDVRRVLADVRSEFVQAATSTDPPTDQLLRMVARRCIQEHRRSADGATQPDMSMEEREISQIADEAQIACIVAFQGLSVQERLSLLSSLLEQDGAAHSNSEALSRARARMRQFRLHIERSDEALGVFAHAADGLSSDDAED